MEKIYSKVNPDLLLHIIFRFQYFNKPRTEIIDADNFLQGAAVRVNAGTSFRSHKHIETDVSYKTRKTQEAWIVMQGLIRCILYDIDDTVISIVHLGEKDTCFTLNGGHTFMALEDHSCILELKTGPYEGQEKDKTFINDKI